MSDAIAVESGQMGRVAYARIAPNEDLVLGVEEIVGGRNPDAEQMDQLAVKQSARSGDVHQVIDGLEEGREQVFAPACPGGGQRVGANGVFGRGAVGSG